MIKNSFKLKSLALIFTIGLLSSCSSGVDPNLANDPNLNGGVTNISSMTNNGQNSATAGAEDPSFTNLANKELNNAQNNDPIYNGFSKNDLTASKNTIFFNFDSYVPSQEYIALIKGHAALLSETQAKVVLEGYTDERGTPEYNITLGSLRAKSIAKLLQNYGVNPDQIRQLSYGEERPLVLGHTENEYAKNRRVVFNYNF